MDPFTITFFRWALAAPLYIIVFGPGVLARARQYIEWKGALLGLTGFTFFNFTLYYSLSHAPASIVGLALGFTPIIIIALAFITRESRPGVWQVLGGALSTLGVLILSSWRGLNTEGSYYIIGIMGGLLAGLLWAIYTVLQNRFYPNSDRAALTYASILLSIPPTTILSAPFLLNFNPHIVDYKIALALVWIALMPGAVAFYMWNKAIAIVGSSRAAPYINLQPVFTAALGYTILGEELTWGDIIGGALIIAGSIIALTFPPQIAGIKRKTTGSPPSNG